MLFLYIPAIFCYSQSNESLCEYSYINALKKDYRICGTGTGFFIKDKGSLFLITNYHSATGFDSIMDTVISNCDSLSLRLVFSTEGSYDSLYFTDLFQERNKGYEYSMKMLFVPDLRVIPVDTTLLHINTKIITINDYIDSNYFDRIPDSVIFCGYPTKKYHADYALTEYYSGIYLPNKYNIFHIDVLFKYLNFNTPKNELIDRYHNLYFYSTQCGTNNTKGGVSGTPVFGLFKEKYGSVIKFIGLVCAALNDETVIVKAKYIFKILNSYNPIK